MRNIFSVIFLMCGIAVYSQSSDCTVRAGSDTGPDPKQYGGVSGLSGYMTADGISANSKGLNFGSLEDFESRELSRFDADSSGLQNSVIKFGFSYRRNFISYSGGGVGLKSDIGYAFIFQNCAGHSKGILMRYPYALIGPVLSVPFSNKDDGDPLIYRFISLYYQCGGMAFGRYTPLVSVPSYHGKPADFKGMVNSFGFSVNIGDKNYAFMFLLCYNRYNFYFNNLRYQYQGKVSRASLNEFCYGLGGEFKFN